MLADEVTGGRARRGRRDALRGKLTASGLAAPPSHLRRTAGCRPSVTLGTTRHRLAAIPPADPASRERPSSPALQSSAEEDHRQVRRLRRRHCVMPRHPGP